MCSHADLPEVVEQSLSRSGVAQRGGLGESRGADPREAVTVDEQWPRALVMRGRKRKGTRYFGPYAHAYAIRDTLDLLLRSFPIRTCSPAKFNQHHRLGRPCLLYHIEKCAGPCVGEIEEMPYRQLVRELCEFLAGDTDDIIDRLEKMAGRRL